MSVRARVVLAFAIFALPATALVIYGSWSARRRAVLEATYATVVERMESGGRELCEDDPARFRLAPRGRGRGRARDGRRVRDRGGEGPPGLLGPARVVPYDASFRSADRRAPAIDPALRDALESGEDVALGVPSPEGARRGGQVDLAMRMPWDEGPCAVLVVRARLPERLAGQGVLLREIGVALAVLLGALAVALIALGPPLSRLRRLADAVRAGPATSYATPRGVGGGDEIGAVARALEEASARAREQVERLESRDRALTDYVDATTHDLAIPLTVLQGRLAELDARVREAGAIDRAAARATLGPALVECEYLGQLVSNMAAAARFAGGRPFVERHDVDLRALTERVVERHAALARQQGVALEHAVPDAEIVVRGDDLLLERALANLVHNAIRHAARRRERDPDAEAHVAVVLERARGGTFRLGVADDGADADLDRVRRALRGGDERGPTTARARGLGLRIVRAVADAHELEIATERTAEGGLSIALEGRCG